jgi:glucose/arabinose dehydrogenase
MAVSPDGVLFVAERGADRIVALPDDDRDGVADGVIEVGSGYGNAQDIEFEADGSLLVAGVEALYRVTLESGVPRESRREVVIDGLPTGGHSTKTVEVLPSGDLLLSIGSSCDVCEEEDGRRAAISVVTAAGDDRVSMRGLRNAVGLWVDDATGRAWATDMGRDRLGDDRPPETLYEVVHGADAGWPRCHAGNLPDPQFGSGADACAGVAKPAATFPAHVAPLALVGWEDHLVIAFHGSWNSSQKVGYAVWWLPWDGGPAGDPQPFATGFLRDGDVDALGRPAGLAVGADGALYVSDDKGGFIYRIARSGE